MISEKVTLGCVFAATYETQTTCLGRTPHLECKVEEMKVALQLELAAARKLNKRILRKEWVVPTIPINVEE
ncbi:hypothetical protein ACLKA6_004366 [Drosophila palustris]